MPQPVLEQVLTRVPMYRRLTAEDRQRLAAVSELRVYQRGDVVFHEGDPPDWFFVIVSGRVKISKATHDGREIILEVATADDPFGGVAVYEGMPYPATARAMLETHAVVTGRQAFFELLAERPSIVRGVLSGLTIRLVELTNRLTELSGGRVEPRVARLFLRLAEERGEKTSAGVFVATPLARQEIADLCGTTVETAIRIMSRWSKENLVRTEREGFLLVHPETLEEIAATG